MRDTRPDYPPEFDEPCVCEVCGQDVDDCECPECPECAEVGDPRCYEAHGLRRKDMSANTEEIDVPVVRRKDPENIAGEPLDRIRKLPGWAQRALERLNRQRSGQREAIKRLERRIEVMQGLGDNERTEADVAMFSKLEAALKRSLGPIEKSLNEWDGKFLQDRFHALHWSDSLYEAVARKAVFATAVKDVTNPETKMTWSSYRRHTLEAVMRKARYPERSTNQGSNLSERYTLQATAELYEIIDNLDRYGITL